MGSNSTQSLLSEFPGPISCSGSSHYVCVDRTGRRAATPSPSCFPSPCCLLPYLCDTPALAPALPASLRPPPPPSCHVPLNSLPLAQENISRKIYFCINVK